MNEQVVELIADKLGIAAEQVSGQIGELFPMLAQSLMAQSVTTTLVSFLIFVVCLIVFVSSVRKIDKQGYYDCEISPTVAAFATGLVGLCAFIIFCLTVAQTGAYLMNPEGTAMIEVLRLLKG